MVNKAKVEDPQYMLHGQVINNTVRIVRRTSKVSKEIIVVPIPEEFSDGDDVKVRVEFANDVSYDLVGKVTPSRKSDTDLIVVHRQVNPICVEVLLVPIPDEDASEVMVPVKVKTYDRRASQKSVSATSI